MGGEREVEVGRDTERDAVAGERRAAAGGRDALRRERDAAAAGERGRQRH